MTDAKKLEEILNRAWKYGWRPDGLSKDADSTYRAEGTGDHLRVLFKADVANTTEIHEDQATVVHVHSLIK